MADRCKPYVPLFFGSSSFGRACALAPVGGILSARAIGWSFIENPEGGPILHACPKSFTRGLGSQTGAPGRLTYCHAARTGGRSKSQAPRWGLLRAARLRAPAMGQSLAQGLIGDTIGNCCLSRGMTDQGCARILAHGRRRAPPCAPCMAARQLSRPACMDIPEWKMKQRRSTITTHHVPFIGGIAWQRFLFAPVILASICGAESGCA